MEVPQEIKKLIYDKKISFSHKAIRYITESKYSLSDFENAILSGELKKKEKDELNISKYKYTIIGPAKNGNILYTCGKIIELEGKNYFFLTLHEAD